MNLEQPDNLGPELSAYLDGELPAARAAEVERWLHAHPEAQVRLDLLRDVRGRLGALPRQAAPPAVGARLRLAAEERLSAPPAAVAMRARPSVIPLVLRITAAAAVIAGSVWFGWEVGRRETVWDAAQPEMALHSWEEQSVGGGEVALAPAPAEAEEELPPAPEIAAGVREAEGAAGYFPASLALARPVVHPGAEIWVQPRNQREYELVLATLADSVQRTNAAGEQIQLFYSERDADPATEIVEASQLMAARDVPALVARLEQDAPGGVLVEMRMAGAAFAQAEFMPFHFERANPQMPNYAKSPPDADSEGLADQRRRVAEAATAGSTASSAPDVAAAPRPRAASGGGEGRVAKSIARDEARPDTAQRARRQAREDEVQPQRRGAAAASRERLRRNPQPAGERFEPGRVFGNRLGNEPQRPAPPASAPADELQEAPPEVIVSAADWLGGWLRLVAQRGAQSLEQLASPPPLLTLRVRVLPPPGRAATQPAEPDPDTQPAETSPAKQPAATKPAAPPDERP